jgi:hypothetical protein
VTAGVPTAATAALALALALAGCVVVQQPAPPPAPDAPAPVLDPGGVEADVAARFEELHGVGLDLDCAEGMTVEAGAVYECPGTTTDGEEVTIRITVTDEDPASYAWEEV